MSQKTIYQVNSFTEQLYCGNPAGVMLLDAPLSDDDMQGIAMEMNLSETAFAVPRGNTFDIRYFTPNTEVPLCGHATLATAHIMYETGIVDKGLPITFRALACELTVKQESGFICMNFPAYSLREEKTPDLYNESLGVSPVEFFTADNDWSIAVVGSEAEVSHATPDFNKMISNGIGHTMITAKSDSPDYDYVVRCFAPQFGINEDSVTGSAQCALVPLWSKKLGKEQLVCKQLSQRGGTLKLENLPKNRVLISGKARTVFKLEMR